MSTLALVHYDLRPLSLSYILILLFFCDQTNSLWLYDWYALQMLHVESHPHVRESYCGGRAQFSHQTGQDLLFAHLVGTAGITRRRDGNLLHHLAHRDNTHGQGEKKVNSGQRNPTKSSGYTPSGSLEEKQYLESQSEIHSELFSCTRGCFLVNTGNPACVFNRMNQDKVHSNKKTRKPYWGKATVQRWITSRLSVDIPTHRITHTHCIRLECVLQVFGSWMGSNRFNRVYRSSESVWENDSDHRHTRPVLAFLTLLPNCLICNHTNDVNVKRKCKRIKNSAC